MKIRRKDSIRSDEEKNLSCSKSDAVNSLQMVFKMHQVLKD